MRAASEVSSVASVENWDALERRIATRNVGPVRKRIERDIPGRQRARRQDEGVVLDVQSRDLAARIAGSSVQLYARRTNKRLTRSRSSPLLLFAR